MANWYSLPRSIVLAGSIGLLSACVTTPYPEPDQPIGLSDRIGNCFIAIPTLQIFGLSGYDRVTKARYPGQCEVWFEFEKFKRSIGRSELYAATNGRTLVYEYDYVLDALKRTITFYPSEVVEFAGVEHRMVTSTATITGVNGTLTAQSRTVWRRSGRSWQLSTVSPDNVLYALSASDTLLASDTEPSSTASEICRLVQSDGDQTKYCRNEAGDWIETSDVQTPTSLSGDCRNARLGPNQTTFCQNEAGEWIASP